jgi:hypothetical protein
VIGSGSSTPVRTGHRGLSVRVGHQRGGEVAPIQDRFVYAAAPEYFEVMMPDATIAASPRWNLSAEGTFLLHQLAQGSRSTDQPASAAAVDARWHLGAVRAQALGTVRSFSFLLRDIPSLPPYQLLQGEQRPEWMGRIAVEYALGRTFSPGVTAAVVSPALLRPAPPLPDGWGQVLVLYGLEPEQARWMVLAPA